MPRLDQSAVHVGHTTGKIVYSCFQKSQMFTYNVDFIDCKICFPSRQDLAVLWQDRKENDSFSKHDSLCILFYVLVCVGVSRRSFVLVSVRLPASNMMVKLSCVHYARSLSLSVYVPRQHLAASWVLMELPKVIPYPFVAEWIFGSWPVSQKPSPPSSWDDKTSSLY